MGRIKTIDDYRIIEHQHKDHTGKLINTKYSVEWRTFFFGIFVGWVTDYCYDGHDNLITDYKSSESAANYRIKELCNDYNARFNTWEEKVVINKTK